MRQNGGIYWHGIAMKVKPTRSQATSISGVGRSVLDERFKV